MNLNERIKEERERLGYSQTAFAALAEASKHSQINWEKGVGTPTAAVLAAWAAHGLDVLYVVTGQRGGDVNPALSLSPKEQVVIELFRKASEEKQNTVLGALVGVSLDPTGARDVNMTNSARGSVQIGVQMGGKVTSRKKSR